MALNFRSFFKGLFSLQFALSVVFLSFLISCSAKKPLLSNNTESCTLLDSSRCPKKNSLPSKDPAEDEVISFYEGMGDNVFEVDDGLEDFGPVIGNEAEAEISRTDQNAPSQFDIPIIINKKVEKWVHYFQTRGRKYFKRWLERSGKYIPMMRRILRENGLPEDLVYLAMIESGFKPYAYSRARASGPWQFIKRTGRLYGLRSNWWIDERRDPEKSSIAAAQHLKDLYDHFQSWYLAAAGYNAGAGKIQRAIARYRTEDFWEMSKFRYLKSETKNYVPKMIAAALVAKSPEVYGFTDINYEEPLQYDKVLVPKPTEISTLTKAMGLKPGTLTALNPELRRNITPPDYPNYELKIPKNYKKQFASVYPSVQEKTASGVLRHVVRLGETLSGIANRYRVPMQRILAFNRLRSRHHLRQGQQLAIPLWKKTYQKKSRVAYTPPKKGKPSTYIVRSGDTLWSISRRFGISVSEIRAWNRISNPGSLQKGTPLKLYARSDEPMLEPAKPKTNGPWKTYRVQKGDNLWDIAKRHGVSLFELARWNELDPNTSILYPGFELKIRSTNL